MYALSEHKELTPLKASEIAAQQHIPIKFLEAILSQLKGGGFVLSKRGAEGGYLLARAADQVKVGEVIRFIDGPIAPVDCVSPSRPKDCEYPGHCPFFCFWGRVRNAMAAVIDNTTFADLVKEQAAARTKYVADWTI